MSVGGRLLSRGSERQVKYVRPVPRSVAPPLQSQVYEQVERDVRVVVPPFLLHSPVPETLAAYWMMSREIMMTTSATSRLAREAAAAAVAVACTCPYCVDMHSIGMYELAGPDDAEALAGDRLDELTDPAIREVAHWARHAHLPGQPPPPATGAAASELVAVVVLFHYLSRMVNVFLTTPLLSNRLQGNARRRVKHGVARILRPTLYGDFRPGAALDLLPDQPLPPDTGWAAGSPVVAGAVARAAAAFETAGRESLTEPVREVVRARLAAWRGEEPGISRGWLDEAVASLPARDRPTARFVLLTALASYQVDDTVVDGFRGVAPDDAALVGAAAWASFAAARRVGERWSDLG